MCVLSIVKEMTSVKITVSHCVTVTHIPSVITAGVNVPQRVVCLIYVYMKHSQLFDLFYMKPRKLLITMEIA